MRIRVTYLDKEAYTVEEAVSKARNVLGEDCTIEILPEAYTVEAYLDIALKSLATPAQLSEFFDGTNDLSKVSHEVMKVVEKRLNRLMVETEEQLVSD